MMEDFRTPWIRVCHGRTMPSLRIAPRDEMAVLCTSSVRVLLGKATPHSRITPLMVTEVLRASLSRRFPGRAVHNFPRTSLRLAMGLLLSVIRLPLGLVMLRSPVTSLAVMGVPCSSTIRVFPGQGMSDSRAILPRVAEVLRTTPTVVKHHGHRTPPSPTIPPTCSGVL